MQWIKTLEGIGKDRKCLIIGGGLSVKKFDFSKLDKNFVKIAVNNAIPEGVKVDYVVYNDTNFLRVIHEIPENVTVIGSDGSPHPRTQYYFRNEEIGCVCNDNTGLRTIQIARLMGFEEIYLTGFDFHTQEVDGKEQSHFYGDKHGARQKYPEFQQVQDHFNRLPIMIRHFDKIKDAKNIFNCYKESSLKLFPFQLPF